MKKLSIAFVALAGLTSFVQAATYYVDNNLPFQGIVILR